MNGNTPNNSNNPGNGSNPSGNGNPQGGNQGGNQGNPQGDNQGHHGQSGVPSNVTPDLNPDGQSHAYFTPPHGTGPIEEKKAPKKGGGGEEHKPYKVEWSKFKGDKKLIMEYLDELFQYVFLECPLQAITNFTIMSVDWFLYAPLSGGASEPEVKKTKNKTILDYRDDVRDEYAAKAETGMKMSVQAHKELKENIEKAQNGLPPTWREWGSEPSWFRASVDLAERAAADPNSPEAQQWKEFEKFPYVAKVAFQKEDVLRYFSLTLAAADVAINSGDMEIPKNVSKNINKMAKIINKSSDVATLKDKMAEKIEECRSLITDGSPINAAISEKLDEIQNIISAPNNDIDKIKKDLNKKIKELKNVNAFPKKIKANSQVYYDSISENIDKILEVYSAQPATAATEVKKYIKQIKDNVAAVEKETKLYVKEGVFNIKKLRRNKVEKRIKDTEKAIDQFDLGGTSINDIPRAAVRHPCLVFGRKVTLKTIREYFGR